MIAASTVNILPTFQFSLAGGTTVPTDHRCTYKNIWDKWHTNGFPYLFIPLLNSHFPHQDQEWPLTAVALKNTTTEDVVLEHEAKRLDFTIPPFKLGTVQAYILPNTF
ncbi:uncharacterized protein LOC108733337 [Agrilus planipennis]|uniref:Uncharacterized protein LOC108733337 n=1 Tax=Agrilus planipennis TaxID=224129 RepID=A0A1W4W771_AGRPL|nr:uncharacterized protein LOC108733337 [Agrilus planipennis]